MKFMISVLLICIAGCVPIDPLAGQDIFIACETDADCDDRIFCNGAEYCDPNTRCFSDGSCITGKCFSGINPCSIGTTCNEQSNMCEAAQPQPANNFDVLRTACSGVPDAEIVASVNAFDAEWWKGTTFNNLSIGIDRGCSDSFCKTCFNAIAYHVYFNLHSVTVDDPPFVSGNVFSFLSVPETEIFLMLVTSANNEITQWRIDELNRIDVEIARGGFGSGSSLARQWLCDVNKEAVRRRRDATWQVLDEHVGLSKSALFSIGATAEVVGWNCQRYPDPTCAIVSSCP